MTKLDIEISTVSDLVSHIKKNLEETFAGIAISGEISNLSLSSSGHWYFTLSDPSACLSCVLFKGDALRNPLIKNLKDGDEIILMGEISVYEKRGVFQFITKRLLPKGEGKLRLEFEKLKKKLMLEGLFDVDKKKPMPTYPQKIVLVTAVNSAALQDFLKVYERRSFGYELLVIPSIVQGDAAPSSIVKSLYRAFSIPDVDVLVLLRGGGSSEDLSAFNNEELVRTVFKAPFPVISAIGHQTDFCLTDYVADLRAETPTAAAEILSQPQTTMLHRLQASQEKLKYLFTQSTHKIEERLWAVQPSSMKLIVVNKMNLLQKRIYPFEQLSTWLRLIDMTSYMMELDEFIRIIKDNVAKKMNDLQFQLKLYHEKINLINPRSVLSRGYCYAASEEKIIKTKKDWNELNLNKRHLHFVDGEILVTKWDS